MSAEESQNQNEGGGEGEADGPHEGDQQQQARSWNSIVEHVSAHKLDCAQWATRICTIVFTIGYFFPFFGNPMSAYYKALMSNAATSALRLHQRLPRVQFTREFLGQLIIEDSCHYLLYSLIFLYAGQMTLVLLPTFLFAVLHASSYTLTLLDIRRSQVARGQNVWWGVRILVSLVEFQSYNLLRLVAFTEIFLMPFTILMLFFGRSSLMTPLVYYRFLTLRYASRRNPHTRNIFHELRLAVEKTVNQPRCPPGVRSFVLRVVQIMGGLAPNVPARQ